MSPARRSRGDGTLTERSPGVWRIRSYAGTDPLTGHPRQVSRTVKGSKTRALKALRKLNDEAAAGKFAATSGTLGHLLAEWLADLERLGKAPTTMMAYRNIVAKHLDPRFGTIPLDKLSAHDLDAYYRDQAGKLAPATINQHHAILSTVLTQGVKWGWMAANPAAGASPPKRPETSRKAPATTQVRRLLEVAADDIDLKTAVLLAVITGARRGELCGLRWGDVDWQGGELRIERQRFPGVGGDQTGPTKSGKPRVVALGQLGVATLAAYRVEQGARAVALGLDSMPVNGWLLSADAGRSPTRTKTLTAAVTALGRRAGVPLTLHETRHFAATAMIGQGTDVTTAAGRLGHTPEMLLRVYAHRIPERDRAAAELLELGVLGALPAPSREKDAADA